MKINKTDLAKSIKQALVIKENFNMSSRDLKDVVRQAVMKEAFGTESSASASAEKQMPQISALESKMKDHDSWQEVMRWAIGQLFNPTTMAVQQAKFIEILESTPLEVALAQLKPMWKGEPEEGGGGGNAGGGGDGDLDLEL